MVTVRFVEEGPLGVTLTENPDSGAIELTGLSPGTQADSHPTLSLDSVLEEVGGTAVGGMEFAEVSALIRQMGTQPQNHTPLDQVDPHERWMDDVSTFRKMLSSAIVERDCCGQAGRSR